MKKATLRNLLLAIALMVFPQVSMAQTYDYSKVDFTKMVDVFYKALQAGRQYPTDEEIEAIGISKADLAFIKSHVKRRATIDDSRRLVQNTYETRKMWLNLPMGSGSGGDAGYPSRQWHNDVFSLWNYTSLWGSWNHSPGQIPGSWTDVAHKNGCDMLGGTVFFDSGSSSAYTTWTSYANATGDTSAAAYEGYTYVKPFIHMLLYFGMDGINVNWEVGTPANFAGFHKALYKYAHSIGFDNFHLGLYTTNSYLTSTGTTYLYASDDEQVADAMLNYGGEYYASLSVKNAIKANPNLKASGLYQGFWIVGMDHSWTYMDKDEYAKQMNFCLWGEHKNSRFWSYNSGAGTLDQQENYQRFLERAFSGGNLNPLNRPTMSNSGNAVEWKGATPPLSTFGGFATYIPERSTVQGKFPFYTLFNLGNGDRYTYRGIKTSGAWYNIAAQDVVPTYRWLVLNAGQEVNESATVSTAIDASFSHSDSYTGGTSLRLKGDATQATDVVLYKTDLTPNDANTYALVATKGGSTDGKSNLSLILHVNGAWKAYAIPDNTEKKWQEHRIELGLGAGDKIDQIGFRVENGTKDYDMYIGELELNDYNKITPASISNLEVTTPTQVETKDGTRAEVKLNWDVDVTPNEYGIAYNDDANIDHFEILYKDSENGKVVEVGRTTQWAALVPNMDFSGAEKPMIGVVAISKDLKTHSEILWQEIPTALQTAEDEFGTYGECILDVNSEGYTTALVVRGVESFKTQGAESDINYSRTYAEFKADNDGGKALFLNYHHDKNTTFKVRQGQTFDFWLKGFDGEAVANNKDDCRYCFVGGWLDFDGSGDYNYGKGMVEQPFWAAQYDAVEDGEENFEFDETSKDGTDALGERVFRAGSLRKGNPCLVKNDGYHGQITIPADAHLGKSRLRIVYSDAWFAGAFSPTSNTTKGYTLDIDVEIVGDNVDGQRQPVDIHDQGDSEDWLKVVTDIKDLKTVDASAATVKAVNGTLVFTNTLKAEIYTANGMLLCKLNRPSVLSGSKLTKGIYIVRLNGKKGVKVVL